MYQLCMLLLFWHSVWNMAIKIIKMKKIIFTLFAFIILISFSSNAQNNNKAKNLEKQLIEGLNLTPQETNKVRQTLLQMGLELNKINSQNINEDQKLTRAINTIFSTDKKIENILGSKQRHEKFVQIVSANSKNKKGDDLYVIIKELNITAEELVSILNVFKNLEPEVSSLQRSTLSEEEKVQKSLELIMKADNDMTNILGQERQEQLLAFLSKQKKNDKGLALYKAIKEAGLTSTDLTNIAKVMKNTELQANLIMSNKETEQQKQSKLLSLALESNKQLNASLGNQKYEKLLEILARNGNSKQVEALKKVNDLNLTNKEIDDILSTVSVLQSKLEKIKVANKSDEDKVNDALEAVMAADLELENTLGDVRKMLLYDALGISF